MNAAFAAAAAVGTVAFLTHSFVGTRHAIPPLLAETRLPAATRGLNYLCWHAVTVLLALMAAVSAAGALGWRGSRPWR